MSIERRDRLSFLAGGDTKEMTKVVMKMYRSKSLESNQNLYNIKKENHFLKKFKDLAWHKYELHLSLSL